MNYNLELDYYDKILLGITFSLVLGLGSGFMTSLPLPYTAGAGAAVAIGLMYHGMFRNGPE